MQEQPWRPGWLGVVPVAPPQQVGDHRQQGATLVRQAVLEALGSLQVGRSFQDALVDQVAQPMREHRTGHPETLDELLEAVPAQQRVAQDQQCPALANHLEGAGDRADRSSTDAAARHQWQVLAVTAVAMFMSFLDVTIVNIAFPSLRADFATTSLPVLSWVINGYGVVFARP